MSNNSCSTSAQSDLHSARMLQERNLIRVFAAFIASGLFFMLIPGTLLGVWNLIAISKQSDPSAATTLWIQAHGHAQLFGWIGTFILGIGFYSIPNLRKMCSERMLEGWLCLLLWGSGVAMRWYAAVSDTAWHILMPLSAVLEFIAVAFFVGKTVEGSIRKKSKKGSKPWALLLISASFVWLTLMGINVQMMLDLSAHSASPSVPVLAGRTFLYGAVWGWIVPTVWGLCARWLPALIGARQPSSSFVRFSAIANLLALCFCAAKIAIVPESIILVSTISMIYGLNLFAPAESSAKIIGVHRSFPTFIKIAFVWLFSSALLFLISAIYPMANGTAGAARHAITVGFFSTMVFNIGPKLLPAFSGRKAIFSKTLMFAASLVLNLGCLLRVASEILAYDFSVSICWQTLPLSAVIELIAMALFSTNMFATLWQKPLLDQFLDSKQKFEAAI